MLIPDHSTLSLNISDYTLSCCVVGSQSDREHEFDMIVQNGEWIFLFGCVMSLKHSCHEKFWFPPTICQTWLQLYVMKNSGKIGLKHLALCVVIPAPEPHNWWSTGSWAGWLTVKVLSAGWFTQFLIPRDPGTTRLFSSIPESGAARGVPDPPAGCNRSKLAPDIGLRNIPRHQTVAHSLIRENSELPKTTFYRIWLTQQLFQRIKIS